MDLQSNQILLQPVETWSPKGLTLINCITFNSYYGYDFQTQGGVVNFTLSNIVVSGDSVTPNTNTPILDDVCTIPLVTFQEWQGNDGVLFTYVINTKGLQVHP